MVGEGSYTKDMVWRRISGRRGRMVEADKKKIWDNRSFLQICCTGLSILKISWAIGVGLSWFFLGWKANLWCYMKTIYLDLAYIKEAKDEKCGVQNWRRMLTKDEGYVDEGCLVMDSQRRKLSEKPKDLLWEMVGEGAFTKDIVWIRISGRRGRRVEADKKKI